MTDRENAKKTLSAWVSAHTPECPVSNEVEVCILRSKVQNAVGGNGDDHISFAPGVTSYTIPWVA